MDKEKNIKLKKSKSTAGGWDAIVHSAKHIFKETGVITGARLLLNVNQFNGFDCPGCAWPDPDEKRSVVEFCENGAKAVAEEAAMQKCDPEFFRNHTISELLSWTDYQIGKSGRLTQPMILKENSEYYEPIEWSEAFQLIGNELHKLASPDEAVFYTSGRTSNEAAFLYQLFVRMYGTNNLPDCSNMCHESSGVALTETVGIGKGTVTLDDFNKTELILVIGQNPGTNHPRMLTALQKAKQNGTTIITINPIPEAGLISFRHPQHLADIFGKPTTLTDLWLPVRINEDVALLKALLRLLLQKEEEQPGQVLDWEFINSKTMGFHDMVKDLNGYDLDQLIEKTGVDKSVVLQAADLIAQKKKIIVCWAMGLTQHKNAVDNIREIVNLLLLKGSIGKPGTGTCPVRGHSNVQGDRTMGIYEKPSESFLENLQKAIGFDPPKKQGYDTVESIQAMADGKVKVFVAMGGNFISATPDTNFTAKALQQCELTVHISTKLNRSHLVHGKTSLILPCLGRTERDVQKSGIQFVSVENSAGVVHKSQGAKEPASVWLLSEPKIVAEMAKATFTKQRVGLNWDDLVSNYDAIRVLIEKTIPGFENYNVRVRKDGGFYLPNNARAGTFSTTTSKAHFTINQVADHTLGKNEYLMMTIRSHDQYNTTIYGLDDRYRGVYRGRRVVFINEQDAKDAGLNKGDVVDIISTYDATERKAENFVVFPYSIPRQNVATYFPEANVLIPNNHFARGSQTPISKSVIVKLISRK